MKRVDEEHPSTSPTGMLPVLTDAATLRREVRGGLVLVTSVACAVL